MSTAAGAAGEAKAAGSAWHRVTSVVGGSTRLFAWRAFALCIGAALAENRFERGIESLEEMQKMKWMILLGLLLAVGCSGDDDDSPVAEHGGSSGSGGTGHGGKTNGGSSNGGTSGNGSGGTTHPELCGLSATCKDGTITGMYGTFCGNFTAECELGCSAAPKPLHQQSNLTAADAAQYAKEALCKQPPIGSGGAGGEGGFPVTAGGGGASGGNDGGGSGGEGASTPGAGAGGLAGSAGSSAAGAGAGGNEAGTGGA